LNSKDSGFAPLAATVGMTIAVQALTAMALAVPSVLAPEVAAELGVAPARVGVWAGAAYFTAMFAGLACGVLVGRYGPVRMFQIAAAFVAVGYAAGASAQLGWVIACALLFGAAHGAVNPASSLILSDAAPAGMRTMIFSIKQTGVPLGAAAAGVAIPLLLRWTDWRHALLALALGAAALMPLIAPFRASCDVERRPGLRLRLGSIAAPLADVWTDRAILTMAVTSAVFSSVQMSFLTYLVSYLRLDLGYELATAGFVFAMAQLAGVIGRIVWGAVADRWFAPRPLLALLGIVMAVCGAIATQFEASWPVALIFATCVIYGATAVGWNGVYLAEIARLAPQGRIAIVTGGTQFFTFFGALFGPPVFGAIASSSGRYGTGFVLFAVLPLANALWLLAPHARGSRHGA
jgi:MFS family permease